MSEESAKRKADQQKVMNERKKVKRAAGESKQEAKIKYYVESSEQKKSLLGVIEKAKCILGGGHSPTVSNYDALMAVFNFYVAHHEDQQDNNGSTEGETNFSGYQYCDKDNSLQPVYLMTQDAAGELIKMVEKHGKKCTHSLHCTESKRLEHAGFFTITCSKNCTQFHWNTSSHIEGGKCLVNVRMVHAYMVSGILPVQYERLCVGYVGTRTTAFRNFKDIYNDVTESEMTSSIQTALREEIANGDLTGINIMTDARHGWRRNAKDTDVVCLGEKTHKVLKSMHVTRREETSSQRHELTGIKHIFKYFDEQSTPVNVHIHDGNTSVTKHLEEQYPDTENSYDTWHATKGITRQMKKITSGPKKNQGKTWHAELSDKAGSIRTHIYWSMKNCNGSLDQLRMYMDNIVGHYKDQHDNCHSTSRCKTDPAYEPTKHIIRSPVAEKLLQNTLHSLPMYRSPKDYIYCQNTHYVESFNNAALIYHDKRIVFGYDEYRRRTNMAIIEWNLNVDRSYTTQTFTQSVLNSRRQTPNKNLKPKSLDFMNSIWNRVMNKYYPTVSIFTN